MLTWERNLRPFLTSEALSQKGPRLALVQGFQPPPPLERLIDFCGGDRLCPGVAGKVFDIGQARLSAFSFSLSLLPPPPSSHPIFLPLSGLGRWEWRASDSCCPRLQLGSAGLDVPQAQRSLALGGEGGVCPLEEQDLG